MERYQVRKRRELFGLLYGLLAVVVVVRAAVPSVGYVFVFFSTLPSAFDIAFASAVSLRGETVLMATKDLLEWSVPFTCEGRARTVRQC
jgi:hypothetical protein